VNVHPGVDRDEIAVEGLAVADLDELKKEKGVGAIRGVSGNDESVCVCVDEDQNERVGRERTRGDPSAARRR
jgi:hypothetical protein